MADVNIAIIKLPVYGISSIIKGRVKAMEKIFCWLFLLLTINSCRADNRKSAKNDSTRSPVVAGQFYPADSTLLLKQIKVFLKNAKPGRIENAIAIIVPHAGYIYSGQIAADAFNQVKQNKYDLIVVLGTNHTTAGFSGISVYPNGAFDTPIGAAKIDNAVSEEILKDDSDINTDLTVHAKEHSIEVQIPFIKYLFPEAKILPVIVGEPDLGMCSRFGKALAKSLKNKKVLIVASSDLSHYPDFDDAIKTDNKTLKTIAGLNSEEIISEMDRQLETGVPQLLTCACGEAPIIAVIETSKELGATKATIISYSNSGYNSLGNIDRVVGYGAVVISGGKSIEPQDVDSLVINDSYVLTSADKKILLIHARKTLEQYFSTESLPLLRDINPMLKLKRGCFVTLKEKGELRGCIGRISGDVPLCTIVGTMALQAAFNDNRFSPLKPDELSKLEIEISVLTPLKRIKSADDIILGKDGVIIKKGGKQAVFLPQVATETGWSKEVFLDQLCYKAGLISRDWENAEL
jgi:AmmeMemoRadiSam system protein B/AmmeMemoRadiSam system protein A